MQLPNNQQWLLDRLSVPSERSIERKALTLIDIIAGEESENRNGEDEAMDRIYRLAHVALGKCGNPHESWKKEVIVSYRAHRRDELKRKRAILKIKE